MDVFMLLETEMLRRSRKLKIRKCCVTLFGVSSDDRRIMLMLNIQCRKPKSKTKNFFQSVRQMYTAQLKYAEACEY